MPDLEPGNLRVQDRGAGLPELAPGAPSAEGLAACGDSRLHGQRRFGWRWLGCPRLGNDAGFFSEEGAGGGGRTGPIGQRHQGSLSRAGLTEARGAAAAPERRSPGERSPRLACPLVGKQKGRIWSVRPRPRSWRPRNEHTKSLDPGGPGWPRTAALAWEASPELRFGLQGGSPPFSRFSARQYKTHTDTHCVNSLFGQGSCRVNTRTGGGGRWRRGREDCGPPAGSGPAPGAPARGSRVRGHQGGEGVSPDTEARLGVPIRAVASWKEPGLRPSLGLGSVPRPKMAPGRCLPGDRGHRDARRPGGGQRAGRRQGGSAAWPARARTPAAARSTGRGGGAVSVLRAPLGRQPGTWSHHRHLRVPRPGAPAGLWQEGRAAARADAGVRGEGGTWGPRPTKARGTGWGGGFACPNLCPNEMQARFATQTRRTLGNANAISLANAGQTGRIFISN